MNAVDQCNSFHRFPAQPFRQQWGKGGIAVDGGMLDIVHGEHQTRRRLAARDLLHHRQCITQSGATAANTGIERQGKDASLGERGKVLERKVAAAVVKARLLRELRPKRARHCDNRHFSGLKRQSFFNRCVHLLLSSEVRPV